MSSLKALSDGKTYPIDLTIGNGKITLSIPDYKGQAELPADTDGELKIRLDGSYLTEALKACGGMVDLQLTDNKSPVLFTTDGYKLVVMPMLTSESQKPKDEEKTTEPEAQKADVVTEAEAVIKDSKPKSTKPNRKREKVAVT